MRGGSWSEYEFFNQGKERERRMSKTNGRIGCGREEEKERRRREGGRGEKEGQESRSPTFVVGVGVCALQHFSDRVRPHTQSSQFPFGWETAEGGRENSKFRSNAFP